MSQMCIWLVKADTAAKKSETESRHTFLPVWIELTGSYSFPILASMFSFGKVLKQRLVEMRRHIAHENSTVAGNALGWMRVFSERPKNSLDVCFINQAKREKGREWQSRIRQCREIVWEALSKIRQCRGIVWEALSKIRQCRKIVWKALSKIRQAYKNDWPRLSGNRQDQRNALEVSDIPF